MACPFIRMWECDSMKEAGRFSVGLMGITSTSRTRSTPISRRSNWTLVKRQGRVHVHSDTRASWRKTRFTLQSSQDQTALNICDSVCTHVAFQASYMMAHLSEVSTKPRIGQTSRRSSSVCVHMDTQASWMLIDSNLQVARTCQTGKAKSIVDPKQAAAAANVDAQTDTLVCPHPSTQWWPGGSNL